MIMMRIIMFAAAVAAFAGTATAGPIDLCNDSKQRIRFALVIKEGFAYLSDTWTNSGYTTLSPGRCERIGGGSWGGSRTWGYVSIESEKTAEDLERERTYLAQLLARGDRERQTADIRAIMAEHTRSLRNFTVYDHLVRYLPGSRQNLTGSTIADRVRAIRSRAPTAVPDAILDRWEFVTMKERRDEIESQGFSGSTFKTCLPKDGFRFTTSGRPAAAETCSGKSERLVKFAIEVFVTVDSTMVVNVGETSIRAQLRR